MTKVVVFGIDAVNSKIMFKLLKYLPNIRRLLNEGCYGNVKSVIPPHSAITWTSIATGMEPGKHNVYNYVYPHESLRKTKNTDSNRIKAKTYYEILNKKGKKNILINLPGSYPPKTDDIIITSFLTFGDEFIFPKSLIDEFPELKGYRIVPNQKLSLKNKLNEYIIDVMKLEKTRFECGKRLFKEKPWDTFTYIITGTDLVFHKKYDELEKKELSKNKLLIDFFKQVDAYLGWFMDNLPKDAVLMVMSDHGFKHYKGMVLVNKLLEKKGWLKFGKSKKKQEYDDRAGKESFKEKRKYSTINIGKFYDFISGFPWLKKFAGFCYKKILKIFFFNISLAREVDLQNTKVYLLTPAHGIFINAKKNFKDGIVDDNEYERLREEVIFYLRNLKDPEGKKAFDTVRKREEVYKGPYVSNAPDIMLEPNNYNIVTLLYGNAFVKGKENSHDINGGIFLVYGKGIKRNMRLEEKNITDIAPTLLHMMDTKIPKDIDGKVMREIFEEDSRFYKKKVRYSEIKKHKEEQKIQKEKIDEIIKNIDLGL